MSDEPEGIPTTTEMGGWPLLAALGVIAVVTTVILVAVFR